MKIKHILAIVLLAVAGLASCQKEEDFTLENTYHLDNLLVAKAEGFNDELYAFTVELAEEGVSGSNGNYSGTGKIIRFSTLEDGKRKVEIDCDDVVYVYEGDI